MRIGFVFPVFPFTCAIPVTEIGTPCVELTWFEVTFKVITFREILGENDIFYFFFWKIVSSYYFAYLCTY